MLETIRALRYRRRTKWESLCNQCGICCLEKTVINGRIHINLDSPCRFLDSCTKTCHVYPDRFQRCRDCRKLTIWHAWFASYLPESCGYVKKYRPWKFPRARYSHGKTPVKRYKFPEE